MVDLNIWTTQGDKSDVIMSEKERLQVPPLRNALKVVIQEKPGARKTSRSGLEAFMEDGPDEERDDFDHRRFQFRAPELTHQDLRELKIKARDKHNAIIYEVVKMALALKDAQDYIKRPKFCQIEL